MKKHLLIISTLVHFLMNAFAYAGLLPGQHSGGNNPHEKEKASQWMKAQPVQFLENKGQMTDMDGNPVPFVLFKAEAPGMNMYITEKGLTYVFIKAEKEPSDKACSEFSERLKEPAGSHGEPVEPSAKAEGDENKKIQWNRIDMALSGATIKKENIIKEGMSADFSQYFLAHCPDGISNVRSYKKITIKKIYPGIDWVLYNSSEKGFKYDFIVHPGADPKQIEFIYSSLNPLQLDKEGNISIQTEIGTLTENAPYSYIKETGKEISTHFSKKVIDAHRTAVTFSLPGGEGWRGATLVIDPQLFWATFFGGILNDGPMSITTDAAGNVFVTGYTGSNDFPLQNAGTYFEGVYVAQGDAFIMKFSNVGVLLWSTFYGGTPTFTNNGSENAYSIATDSNGNVFVTGETNSTNFPVQNAGPGTFFQATLGGTADAFILKFDNAGNRLWATYYGGGANDNTTSIATDGSGNVLVTGRTSSANFPVQNAGAGTFFQGVYGGGTAFSGDAFILKFDNAGNRLWATYYGGRQDENSNSIASDGSGNVFVTGRTNSPALSFPLQNAGPGTFFQNTLGGWSDAFILKFDNAGNRIWATYYGGQADDNANSIATDGSGNVFVTGETSSANFPLQNAGAGTFFQGVHGGGANDAFILKFDNTGNRLWATYYGGPGNEIGEIDPSGGHLAIDACGNVYVSFSTQEINNLIPPSLVTQPSCDGGYYNSTFNGRSDIFITHFSNTGALLWATYLGGNANDRRSPIALDNTGSLFVSGEWGSLTGAAIPLTYPLTDPGSGAYFSSIYKGWDDAFMVKFNKTPLILNTFVNVDCACNSSAAVNPTGGCAPYSYFWSNGQTTQTATGLCAGSYTVTVSSMDCSIGTATVTIASILPDNASFSYSQSTFCQTGANPSPTVTGLTGGTFSSTAGLSINATTGEIDVAASALGTYTVTYTTNGTCPNSSTFNVTVTLTPDATFSYTGPYCQNATPDPFPIFPVGASAGVFSAMPADLVFISTITGQIDLAASTPGTYTVTNSIAASGGCAAASADNTVTINTAPVLAISNPAAVCNPTTVDLTTAAVTTGSTGSGTLSYWTDAAATNALVSPDAVAVSGTYYIQSTTAAGCSDIEPVTVTINPAPVLTITNPIAVCSPGTVDITAAAVTAGSTGGGTLSYWTDAAATNALASPNALAVSGIYYIQSATAAGCSNIEPVTVNVNPAPVLAITNPATVCSPVTVDITAAAVTFGSTGGGILSYWTDAAATNALASSNALAVSGIYYIQSTTAEGCSDIEPVTVTIHPLPTPVVTPAAASICTGTGTSLTASGASTYSWSPAAGLSSTNGATVSANPAITTTYTVTGTDTNTCVNTTTVTVTVQPLPILSVASDSICEGENTMIDAIASGGTAPYAYLWNPGAMTGATVNVSPSVTTTYTVVMSDANNCFSSPQLATVTVFPNPVANFEMIPPDYAPVSNPLILFTDQSTGADHWLWNFGDILNSLSTLKDPSFTFADEGMYHVTLVITNNEGCTDSVSHTIIIESDFNIYIPSAFTPDNDGLNDFFAPQGTEFNSFEMEIYNRWGERVYHTTDIDKPWDGRVKGENEISKQDVYVYKIWVKDFKGDIHYYVGNVTLIR